MAKTWDKRKDESIRAYNGFQLYMEMGPDRSLKAVAKTLQIAANIVGTWSSNHEWVSRCSDWEEYLAEAQRLRTQKIMEQDSTKWAQRRLILREKEFTLAEKLMERAEEILALPVTKITNTTQRREIRGEIVDVAFQVVEPVKVTFRDAAAMAEIASKLLRLSAEMETSRNKVDVNVTTDATRLEAAKKALENIRDEMLAVLLIDNPGMDSGTAMEHLAKWVAEDWKVQPELLLEGRSSMEDAEILEAEIVEEEPPPSIVDGVIVINDEDEKDKAA